MNAPSPAVIVEGAEIRYGSLVAAEAMNFSIAQGDFLAIVGPNGSGKSSLIRALLGLVPFTKGAAIVLGHAPGSGSNEIGYVPQVKTFDPSFPAQAIEIVASGLHQRWNFMFSSENRNRCLEAMKQVGVEPLAERALSELSGGQLQRVYLARALVRSPKLILLDEPATGVDYAGQADFYQLLEGIQKKTRAALIMVTHDLEVASHHATHVLLMNRRQVAFGSPGEVLSESKLAAAFGHLGHSHGFHPTGGHHHS